jgi:hypothetical protein
VGLESFHSIKTFNDGCKKSLLLITSKLTLFITTLRKLGEKVSPILLTLQRMPTEIILLDLFCILTATLLQVYGVSAYCTAVVKY